MKSARGTLLRHQERAGVGCVAASCNKLGKELEKGGILVDSGCTFNFFTSEYSVFKVSENTGKNVTVELGGKNSYVVGNAMCTVEIPVICHDNRIRILREECSISSQCRYPLLGSMTLNGKRRGLVLGENIDEKIQVQGTDSNFWAKVLRTDTGAPFLDIAPEGKRKIEMYLKEKKHNNSKQSKQVVSVACLKKESPLESNQIQLQNWHRKYGHAKGRRLLLTLKEAGVIGNFTEKDCLNIDCPTCDLINRKSSAIPRVFDVSRQNMKTGEEAFQDLTDMPKAFDGSRYLSVIVDAHSRLVSLMALRSKDKAIVHGVKYIRNMENLGAKVKRWSSDNGKEFINSEYTQLLSKEGIDQNPGSPYTPQSQGVVERMNQTVKSLIGKLLRETSLPVSIWPALLPGVAQQLNSCVHSGTGESPYKRANHPRNGKPIGLTAGDVVSVIEPRSKVSYEGWFGGYATSKVAYAICKVSNNRWRVLRIHPSLVKLVPGHKVPSGGSNPLKSEIKSTDIENSSNEDYQLILDIQDTQSNSINDSDEIEGLDPNTEKQLSTDDCKALRSPLARAPEKINVEAIENGQHIQQVDFSHRDSNDSNDEDSEIEYYIPVDLDSTSV